MQKKLEKLSGDRIASVSLHTILYLIGNVFSGIANIITIPIYFRALGIIEFGVYGLIESTISVALIFSNLGTSTAYLKYCSDHPDKVDSLFWTEAAITLVLSVVTGVVSSIVVNSLNSSIEFGVTVLMFLVVLTESFFQIILTDLRSKQKAIAYNLYVIIRAIFLVALGFMFTAVYQFGTSGILLSRLLGNAIIVISVYLSRYFSSPIVFSWNLCNRLIRYGIPLFWSGLFGNLLDVSGRYVLAWSQQDLQLGYYAVIAKVSNVFILIFSQPFALAWGGFMFRIAKTPNAKTIYARVRLYTLIASFIVTLAISAVSPLIFELFTGDVNQLLITLFIVFMFSRFLSFNEQLSSIGIYLSEKSWWLSIIHGCGLIICLVLHLSLAPTFGAIAIVWNIAVAAIFIITSMNIISEKLYPLPYNWTVSVLILLTWLIIAKDAHIISRLLLTLGW